MVEKAYLTRRDALRLGLSLTALSIPAYSKDFWEEKPSTDWKPDEIDRLLTKSPWAKEASVSYNGGPGGYGNRGSRRGGYPTGGIGFPGGGVGYPGGYPGRYPGGGYPGGGYPGSTNGGQYPGGGGGRDQFSATVRWESALPIQQALHLDGKSKLDPEFEKYYVIQVLGDLPDMGARRRRDDSKNGNDQINTNDDAAEAAQDERRLDMFKQYTKIDRKNGFLNLEKVEQGSRTSSHGPGTLFYFSRQDEISLDDGVLTFITKMGPVEIKAKFSPKEMKYQGKLAV